MTQRHNRIIEDVGKSHRGFTLLEVLVVTSVISLLLSVMLPSLSKARESARRTVCVANLKHIGVGLFSYSTDNRDLGPAIMRRLGTTAPRSLLSRPGQLVNLGRLSPDEIDDPELFYCPSQKRFNFRAKPDELKLNNITGSYAYSIHIRAEQSPRFASVRHLALASDDFVARLGDVGIGKSSHRFGYNALFTDGSATWYSDPDESIWKQSVKWDDETDDITYDTLYDPEADLPPDSYGDAMDIFKVWHSICYNRRDPF